jgi:hypothetical protein
MALFICLSSTERIWIRIRLSRQDILQALVLRYLVRVNHTLWKPLTLVKTTVIVVCHNTLTLMSLRLVLSDGFLERLISMQRVARTVKQIFVAVAGDVHRVPQSVLVLHLNFFGHAPSH